MQILRTEARTISKTTVVIIKCKHVTCAPNMSFVSFVLAACHVAVRLKTTGILELVFAQNPVHSVSFLGTFIV